MGTEIVRIVPIFYEKDCNAMSAVVVAGVGMTPFVKPSAGLPYTQLGATATRAALADAGVDYSRCEQAYVGWVYADSAAGQAALYGVGLTGIPIVNVNNNCSTGSAALYLARQAIASGAADCVLALGFEQMSPGAIDVVFSDRPSPLQSLLDVVNGQIPGAERVPMAIRLFGGAGHEYQRRFGAPDELFAQVRVKASRHAEHNERAIFRKTLTVDEVLVSPKLFLNVTRLEACPPSCGGAAAVLCSESFARANGISTAIRIRAQAMTTDTVSTYEGGSLIHAVGYEMTRAAAEQVYRVAGVSPHEMDVVELHDCFAQNEVLTYESLGLCGAGESSKFVADGDNTYGGRVVTNPSGGLLSKGHPLGATGLGQCAELVWQLRGSAGKRQVEHARLGLQHNIGLGGACVVTLYERV
jgi:sterol carrier protein 2